MLLLACSLGFLLLFLVFKAVFLVEAVYTSTSFSKFLTSSIKWMALGASFNAKFVLYRTSFESVATCASHRNSLVIWMNTCFHSFSSPFALNHMRDRVIYTVPVMAAAIFKNTLELL